MNKHLQKTLTFPYHIVLLPFFFVWHVLNSYFSLIPFSYWSPFLGYYIILSIGLLFIGFLFLKNIIKAGCWCTSVLIVFFFWGAAHDALKGMSLPPFWVSYKFLLTLSAIIIIALSIILKKKKQVYKINLFLSLLFTILVLIEAGICAYKIIRKEYLKNNLAWHNKQPLPVSLFKIDTPPDIFFLVLDEYASTPALKKYLNYDNSKFDSLLLKNNFFIAHRSQSNYDITPLSLASSFNMQYFEVPLEGKKTTRSELLKYQYSLKESLLPRVLHENGYKIINLGVCDLKNAKAPHQPYFDKFINGALYGETLWGRIQKEIAWHFHSTLWLWQSVDTREHQDDAIAINSTNYTNFLKELRTDSPTPRFVYGHLMLPHTPYYLNRIGQKRSPTIFDVSKYNDSLYIDQLIYTNTLIDTLMQTIKAGYNRPRIIIIEGDHGKRLLNVPLPDIVRDRQFMNLSSYYFSDGDYSLLYDSISPINSFRIVLNKYFQANLPLLKDSTVLLLE